MATTSSNLMPGTASSGRDNNGKRKRGRVAGLVATAAVGLGLLAGVVAGHADAAPQLTLATRGGAGTPHWSGTCRAGGSDCVPGDDDTALAPASAAPHGWTGSCRAGGSDCVPDEDLLATDPAEVVMTSHDQLLYDGTHPGFLEMLPGENHDLPFVADQFTYREDHRANVGPSVTSFLPGLVGLVAYA